MKKKINKFLWVLVLMFILTINSFPVMTNNSVNVLAASTAPYKIHFINVGSGDAILLESNGQYGLIDGGEDSYHFVSKANTEIAYQDVVKDYIKRIAGDANGKVNLKFIILSHIHSDHIGGVREIIADPNFTVNQIYMKNYTSAQLIPVTNFEKTVGWDSVQQYNSLIGLCNNKVEIKSSQTDLNSPISLGNFTINLYNTSFSAGGTGEEVNANSLVAKVSANGKAVVLSADIQDANETSVANAINGPGSPINLVKVPHHGYEQSSPLISKIKPKYAIITNWLKNVSSGMKTTLNTAGSTAYTVSENNNIVLDFSKADYGLSAYKTIKQVGVDWITTGNTWYRNTTTKDSANNPVRALGFSYDPAPNSPGFYGYYLRRFANDCGTGAAGTMVTGWVNYNEDWYYFRPAQTQEYGTGYTVPAGSMARGWLQDGFWYYLRPRTNQDGLAGSAATGWLNVDNVWYYMIPSQEGSARKGAMVTGKRNIDGTVYEFNSSGALVDPARPKGK